LPSNINKYSISLVTFYEDDLLPFLLRHHIFGSVLAMNVTRTERADFSFQTDQVTSGRGEVEGCAIKRGSSMSSLDGSLLDVRSRAHNFAVYSI
jgi:hypothetical protein